MEPDNSPRKIQFTVPLLEPHLDPEAAEQIRRRRPTPATLVLTSDQSSPEIDEDRIPNPLLKSTLSMSPRQRKKMTRTTPTMKELQTMVEHHLGQQKQGEEPEEATESTGTCPLEIPDTGSASRLGTPGIAQKPAASTPKIQEQCGVQPRTKDPSAPLPPADSQGTSLCSTAKKGIVRVVPQTAFPWASRHTQMTAIKTRERAFAL
ncbi:protein phosphatase 1 regulatory subunit 1A [Arvicola amphibius]|uniref:protein phosphatase 1 regulatory subunit 1A n=1 Tax=Arvicola amphibius TaxID=1047088 RepID=UPI001C0A0CBB|nr:protein phosphatase 1 regulatory subunit 1A [Arvicola amphibius]